MHSKKQKKSYPRRRKKVARKVEKKSPNKLKKKSPNKLEKRVPKSAENLSKMTSIFGSKKKVFFVWKLWNRKIFRKGDGWHLPSEVLCTARSAQRRVACGGKVFFFCTVSRKLICESKKYKFEGFKHAFFVACTARRAEAGLTHRNAELQRSWK